MSSFPHHFPKSFAHGNGNFGKFGGDDLLQRFIDDLDDESYEDDVDQSESSIQGRENRKGQSAISMQQKNLLASSIQQERNKKNQ